MYNCVLLRRVQCIDRKVYYYVNIIRSCVKSYKNNFDYPKKEEEVGIMEMKSARKDLQNYLEWQSKIEKSQTSPKKREERL